MVQVPPLQLTDYLNAAADVFVFGAVSVLHGAAVVVVAEVLQSAVAAAAVLCVVAAAVSEPAVAVSAVGMFVIGVLVVHDVVAVAVVVAGPQALLIAFARGHCFAVD